MPLIYKIFDSKVHGDPATPLLTAYTGERAIIRLLMPGDKPRNIGFLLHDHEWLSQPDNPLSNTEAMKGAISVGNVYNIELSGGTSACAGDYLYRSWSLRWDVESGMWGILILKSCTLRQRCVSVCRSALQKLKKTRKSK